MTHLRTKTEQFYSVEMEQTVLASMITDSDALHLCLSELNSDCFHIAKHQTLFNAVKYLQEQNSPVDLPILFDYLVKEGIKDIDPSYLSEITRTLATTVNIKYYISALKQYYITRKTEEAMLIGLQNLENGETKEILSTLEDTLSELTAFQDKKRISKLEEIKNDFIDWMENHNKANGMLTGFREYDEVLGGVRKGELVFIAARPGVGKTALALNIAHNIAKEHHKIIFFSMDMAKVELYSRLTSSVLGIDNKRIQENTLTELEIHRFINQYERIDKNIDIYIDDSPTVTIEDIITEVKKLKREIGCDLVVIDYLQKIYDPNERRNDNQKLERIVKKLKSTIARELDTAVICLAQLNRNLESRSNKEPIMSDIRGSGQAEQEADKILFLYREDIYDNKRFKAMEVPVKVIVAKHRQGEGSTYFYLNFVRNLLRFRNIEKPENISEDANEN